MANLLSDLKLALRAWRAAPTFTAIAVASIALGIGANTAIFTLVDQVLLRTLPIHNPHELVQVTSQGPRYGSNWGDGSELSFPMYTDLRDHNQVFSGMLCRFGVAMHVGYSGRTERVLGEVVTGTYFPVLGVEAAVGRTFTPDDDRAPGGHPLAVLSYAYWTSRFAADPNVVGRPLIINSHPFTIIGVTRRGFDGVELGRPVQVFVPMMMKAQMTPGWNGLDDPRYHWVRIFARLRPGVTPEQAQAGLQPFYRSRLEMEVKAPAFAKAADSVRQRFVEGKIDIVPSAQGRSGFRRQITRPLWILMAIAGGVLLIACANVANLLLARAAGRQREMAIRLALGASRWRLIRQLLVESVLLALAGGIAGVALAASAAPVVLSFFVIPETPDPVSTLPDLRILGITFGIATFTGVLFGLAPAFQSTRPALAPTLKNEAGSVLGGGQARVRKALVASQVSVSLLLLVGAGLFLRTLDNLLAVDVGLATSELISFSTDPGLNGYTPERTQQFAKAVIDRLHATTGVVSAGLATVRLLEGNQWSSSMTVEGYQPKADENMSQLNNAISPGYFKTMGVPVLMGREFDWRDAASPNPESKVPTFRVAIVNERFARQYFGSENPIGRRIGFGSDPNTPTPIEIVGVVRDSKYRDVRDDARSQVFLPYLEINNPGGFTVYVRTEQGADAMFRTVRATMQQLDPNLPIHSLRTLDRQVAQSLRSERLVATMSTAFGTLATLLAVVGLYGVMAFTVARRTREIGIRMALGARASEIGWMVIRETVTIATIGVALALPLAWWLSRYVASQLYGVEPTDPITIAGAITSLGTVAIVAGLVPSNRAARIQPTTALRYE